MPASAAKTKNADRLSTVADVALRFNVNERTVARWLTLPGFPPKTRKGWNAAAVERFLRDASLGPFRRSSGGSSPLKEAIRIKTIQQAELARVRKERALVEQAVAAGKLIPIESAIAHYRQTVATIIAAIEGFSSARDRELPESLPTAEAWASLRERLRELDAKLAADIAAALDDLSHSPTDTTTDDENHREGG